MRTGQVEGNDDWEVTSVLTEKSVGEEKAEEQAREIVEKIEASSCSDRGAKRLR